MPIDGHRPGLNRAFLPKICTPCRAGDHPHCRPFTERPGRRLLYCECLGWERTGPDLIILPCLLPEETP